MMKSSAGPTHPPRAGPILDAVRWHAPWSAVRTLRIDLLDPPFRAHLQRAYRLGHRTELVPP